jgi:hypothetical protein
VGVDISRLGGRLVTKVTIRSAVLPDISFSPFGDGVAPEGSGDGGGGADGGGGPSLLLRLLRPSVVVDGAVSTTIEPAGPPPSTPWVGYALVGGLVVALGLSFLAGYAAAE